MRLDEGTNVPLCDGDRRDRDPQLAYTAGKYTALEARAAGIHWIFAPDADVNDNPGNPIINIRSFGEDPRQVAEFATQFIRGIEENGGLATAKHFPGHGDVSVDSHLSLPVVPDDRKELENNELVPFRAAISAGVRSIMPGHLAVPALEPDATVPASLSRNILTGLLREDMKFRGLDRHRRDGHGWRNVDVSSGRSCHTRSRSRGRFVLQPPLPDAALEGLEQAVKSGSISKNASMSRSGEFFRQKRDLGSTRIALSISCG